MMPSEPKKRIIVLDFGSQYNQLIVRRIRELGVYSELLPHDAPFKDLTDFSGISGIILSGGPRSVYDSEGFLPDPRIFELKIPVLGICYGMQAMVYLSGGTVSPSLTREYGRKAVRLIQEDPLLEGISNPTSVWMSHGDEVLGLPEAFVALGYSDDGKIALIRHRGLPLYGVQFHPEVRHTEQGMKLLDNFIRTICSIVPDWSLDKFIDEKIAEIRASVGSERVLMGVSGGVDSSVAAVLIHRAIGDRLTCLFIDHGLMRKNEAEQVMDTFQNTFGIKVIKVDAQKQFLKQLEGITDPEAKRKIIGREFISVFDAEARKIGEFRFLGQGTLYTDLIESGTKTAATIKSHHNVGGLPKDMNFKLVEPLNRLFKDEVRLLGVALGIHPKLLYRQPFPGPGLAIRIIGEVTDEKLRIVREADSILHEEIAKAGIGDQVWQYFALLPGIRSVGVMGDSRTYLETVAIRAVTSVDGMTSDWARLPFEVLDSVSRRIVNEVCGCNRVVYDITSKPPSTIEWE
jgi:GMP synthase (glutamine-hydrolysing)